MILKINVPDEETSKIADVRKYLKRNCDDISLALHNLETGVHMFDNVEDSQAFDSFFDLSQSEVDDIIVEVIYQKKRGIIGNEK